METLQDFIHRLRCQNHLNVAITDSGSERVNCPAGEQIFVAHSGVPNVGLLVHAVLE